MRKVQSIPYKIDFFIFLFFIFSVYLLSFRSPFFWDDWSLIINNPNLCANPFKAFLVPLHSSYSGNGGVSLYYRPLQSISYTIDFILWQARPFGFHLTNMLLHFFNTLLIYNFLKMILKQRTAAFFAALLFAIHPLFVTVVTYISGRADLLMFFFILLSATFLLKYFEGRGYRHLVFSFFSFLAALLSKESAAVYLLSVIFICVYFKKENRSVRSNILIAAGFFIVICSYLFLRSHAVPMPMAADLSGNAADFLITLFRLFSSYVLLGLFPINAYLGRSVVYGQQGFLSIASLVFSISVLIYFLFLKKNVRELIFLSTWFLFSLLPLCGFDILFGKLNNEVIMPDNQFYLASPGFFGLLGIFFSRLVRENTHKIPRIIFFSLYFLFLAVQTARINSMWKDEISIFRSFLMFNRKDAVTNYLLLAARGEVFRRHGKSILAEENYLASLKIKEDSVVYNNLANIYLEEKKFNDAKAMYERSIELDSKRREPKIGLALAYFMSGDIEHAEILRKDLDPYSRTMYESIRGSL